MNVQVYLFTKCGEGSAVLSSKFFFPVSHFFSFFLLDPSAAEGSSFAGPSFPRFHPVCFALFLLCRLGRLCWSVFVLTTQLFLTHHHPATEPRQRLFSSVIMFQFSHLPWLCLLFPWHHRQGGRTTAARRPLPLQWSPGRGVSSLFFPLRMGQTLLVLCFVDDSGYLEYCVVRLGPVSVSRRTEHSGAAGRVRAVLLGPAVGGHGPKQFSLPACAGAFGSAPQVPPKASLRGGRWLTGCPSTFGCRLGSGPRVDR